MSPLLPKVHREEKWYQGYPPPFCKLDRGEWVGGWGREGEGGGVGRGGIGMGADFKRVFPPPLRPKGGGRFYNGSPLPPG